MMAAIPIQIRTAEPISEEQRTALAASLRQAARDLVTCTADDLRIIDETRASAADAWSSIDPSRWEDAHRNLDVAKVVDERLLILQRCPVGQRIIGCIRTAESLGLQTDTGQREWSEAVAFAEAYLAGRWLYVCRREEVADV